jgi:hypothetical protein
MVRRSACNFTIGVDLVERHAFQRPQQGLLDEVVGLVQAPLLRLQPVAHDALDVRALVLDETSPGVGVAAVQRLA